MPIFNLESLSEEGDVKKSPNILPLQNLRRSISNMPIFSLPALTEGNVLDQKQNNAGDTKSKVNMREQEIFPRERWLASELSLVRREKLGAARMVKLDTLRTDPPFDETRSIGSARLWCVFTMRSFVCCNLSIVSCIFRVYKNIVMKTWFDNFILFLIVAYCVLLAVDTPLLVRHHQ